MIEKIKLSLIEMNKGQIDGLPKNPRFIKDEKFKKLVKSIEENPEMLELRELLVYPFNGKYVIIGGNMRYRAMEELGYKEAVCKVIPETATIEQLRAYTIKDNNSFGEWDFDLLANDYNFDELENWGVDLPNMDLESEEKEIVEDEAPEVDEYAEPIAKLGDIWQLGRHRLMCGDSTDKEAVELLMNGKKADMVFTSPPYNGDNSLSDGDIFKKGSKNKRLYGDGYSDNLKSFEYVDFCKKVLNICFENTDGFIFWNVNYNAKSRYEYIAQITEHLPFLVEQICWEKTSAIPLFGSMRRAWEPIYVFSTKKETLKTEEVISNLWRVSNTGVQIENHKACFPVELPAKAIKIVKPKTGVVLEPFGGSGSTLIACEQLNRTCYMMELDPKYCDVIIKRWETLTGEKAVKLN